MFLNMDFIASEVTFFISFVLFDFLHDITVVLLSKCEWFITEVRLLAVADRNLPCNLIPVL